jgi:hypothetical protein
MIRFGMTVTTSSALVATAGFRAQSAPGGAGFAALR